MKQIKIADTTLCRSGNAFRFKEQIEIARNLEKLDADIIELPEIQNAKTDTLLIRTISSFVKKSILSVGAGTTKESVDLAGAALSSASYGRIRIELPTSPVGMEYHCHKKAPAMLAYIAELIAQAKSFCADVEFCALDATRAESDFLMDALNAAKNAGATAISVCDDAAEMLPDEFAAFIRPIADAFELPIGVKCNNRNGMACASSVLAVRAGVDTVKTAVSSDTAELDIFAGMIKNCGDRYGFCTGVRTTELHRNVKQIKWILDNGKNDKNTVSTFSEELGIRLDANDDREAVAVAAAKLGYDLSDEDLNRVYEEFANVAAKLAVGAKELEAIIASVALQVPATYKLISYVVNTGNILSSSAQITMEKNGKTMQGVCLGDGPVDAAFRAVEQIVGHHYELDDFQIQSVTEGKNAMGSAIVKLRSEGKLYSGNGISTDIIGASIRAYINAVNKIVYEEV